MANSMASSSSSSSPLPVGRSNFFHQARQQELNYHRRRDTETWLENSDSSFGERAAAAERQNIMQHRREKDPLRHGHGLHSRMHTTHPISSEESAYYDYDNESSSSSVKSTSSNDEPNWACRWCAYKGRTKNSLAIHKRLRHWVYYSCKVCKQEGKPDRFDLKAEIKAHFKDVHKCIKPEDRDNQIEEISAKESQNFTKERKPEVDKNLANQTQQSLSGNASTTAADAGPTACSTTAYQNPGNSTANGRENTSTFTNYAQTQTSSYAADPRLLMHRHPTPIFGSDPSQNHRCYEASLDLEQLRNLLSETESQLSVAEVENDLTESCIEALSTKLEETSALFERTSQFLVKQNELIFMERELSQKLEKAKELRKQLNFANNFSKMVHEKDVVYKDKIAKFTMENQKTVYQINLTEEEASSIGKRTVELKETMERIQSECEKHQEEISSKTNQVRQLQQNQNLRAQTWQGKGHPQQQRLWKSHPNSYFKKQQRGGGTGAGRGKGTGRGYWHKRLFRSHNTGYKCQDIDRGGYLTSQES